MMNSTRIIRIALSLGFVLTLVAACHTDWITHLSVHPAFALDSFQKQPPRQKEPKAPTDQPENEEVIKAQSSISVSVDLVSLQVLVTDTKGNVLTGLRPENFTIYEDNVKQEISNFSSIESNITVVMLVEFSRNVEYFITDVWNAMYAFANTLRKDDWVAVIGYDMRPTILCDFTQDRKEIYDALRRFTIPVSDDSNLSDALIDALDRTDEIEGKVAILLLSTGLDTFSRHTYEDALNKCKESNASVYAISLGQYFRLYLESLGYRIDIDLLMADNRLKSFADFTGGAAYFPRFQTELPAIFNNISQLLRSQYSIAYASSNTKKDGKLRKIRVDVDSKLTDAKGKPLKLKVVHRKGYVAKD
ncbi:MAG: VWA domain-containing protein [Acidobacteria bacterium]|nr:VWA domain-containing protein [Acidobacteriota bacterium]